MTTRVFIQQALKRNDDLFKRIYEFNHLVSEYIDPSYLEMKAFEVFKPYWEVLKKNSRQKNRLSAYLVRKMGLEGEYFYDFSEPRLRLALMDRQVLEKLFIYAGGVLFSEKIKQLIAKEKVLALKESIGEAVYFFATKRSGLLTGIIPSIEINDEKSTVLNRDQLYYAGKKCFEVCLANEAEALLERIKLKFPKDLEWNFVSQEAEEKKTKSWHFLNRLLTKEVEPNLKICFT